MHAAPVADNDSWMDKIRLVNLNFTLSVLAGAKTQTGQTAPKKDPVLSKGDVKFFPHSDRHKRDIRC